MILNFLLYFMIIAIFNMKFVQLSRGICYCRRFFFLFDFSNISQIFKLCSIEMETPGTQLLQGQIDFLNQILNWKTKMRDNKTHASFKILLIYFDLYLIIVLNTREISQAKFFQLKSISQKIKTKKNIRK